MHQDIGIAASTFDFMTWAITIIESPIIPQPHPPVLVPTIKTLSTYASMVYVVMPEQMTIPNFESTYPSHNLLCIGPYI